MGLKLKQLLEKQPPYIINKASGLVITKLKKVESKKTGLPAITAHITDPNSKNEGHNCQIVTIPNQKSKDVPDLKTGHVKVSCDCVTGDTKVLTDLKCR
jgi:hypothetical protein